MKALILRGKHKGEEVKISQWCNDWFTIDTGTMMDLKPFSPASLAFKMDDLEVIQKHNPGMMFAWYRIIIKDFGKGYMFTFKKK